MNKKQEQRDDFSPVKLKQFCFYICFLVLNIIRSNKYAIILPIDFSFKVLGKAKIKNKIISLSCKLFLQYVINEM